MTLAFSPCELWSDAKVQGQPLVGSEGRVETNGRTDRRTDGSDCITSLANAVGKYASWGDPTIKCSDADAFAIRTQRGACTARYGTLH